MRAYKLFCLKESRQGFPSKQNLHRASVWMVGNPDQSQLLAYSSTWCQLSTPTFSEWLGILPFPIGHLQSSQYFLAPGAAPARTVLEEIPAAPSSGWLGRWSCSPRMQRNAELRHRLKQRALRWARRLFLHFLSAGWGTRGLFQ